MNSCEMLTTTSEPQEVRLVFKLSSIQPYEFNERIFPLNIVPPPHPHSKIFLFSPG